MAGMFDISPLRADACRSDPCASCRYWHAKARLAEGETLSPYELDLIGAYEPRRSNGGWRQPGNLSYYELDRYEELSSEDSAMLSALMSVDNVVLPPAYALEFLSG